MISFLATILVKLAKLKFHTVLFLLSMLGMPRNRVERQMRLRGEMETQRKLLRDNIALLDSIQTSNSDPLRLLGAVEGTMSTERTLHEALSEYRVSGEWFRFDGEVRDYIQFQLGEN